MRGFVSCKAGKASKAVLLALASLAVLAMLTLPLSACGGASHADVTAEEFATVSDRLYSPDPDQAESGADDAGSEDATGEGYWDGVLAKYRGDDQVNQILLVKYEGGSSATSQFLVKAPEEENGWSLVFEERSYVGRDGAGEASCDRAATPMGDFAVLEGFGICADPGTSLPYVHVTDTVYASCECSEDCPYFNTIHDVAENGHWECSGEHMIECSPDYDYGLNFDYNPEKDFYKGSAFFVHCKGYYAYTGGCVALDYGHMITVLQMAEPGMRVVIGDA